MKLRQTAVSSARTEFASPLGCRRLRASRRRPQATCSRLAMVAHTSLGVDVLVIASTPSIGLCTRSLAQREWYLADEHLPRITESSSSATMATNSTTKSNGPLRTSSSRRNREYPAHRDEDRQSIPYRRRSGPLCRVRRRSSPRPGTGLCAIAVDCANGAAYKSTPCILRELRRAEVHVVHNAPNGTNINANCGRARIQLSRRWSRERARVESPRTMEIADRVLLCDENGELVDGDEIMAIAASDLLEQGRLTGDTWSPRS